MKECTKCKTVKPTDCFDLNPGKALGLRSECKTCREKSRPQKQKKEEIVHTKSTIKVFWDDIS